MNTTRIFLHIISVCGWVGGQLLMVALVPTLRKISADAPRLAAARFGKFSWTFMALALITGVWGMGYGVWGVGYGVWGVPFGQARAFELRKVFD